MDFTEVIVQVIVLFFIMFLGYALRSKKIITEEGIKNFSTLIFYVTMPALIISSMSSTKTTTTSNLVEIIIASAISYSFLLIMAFILPQIVKAPKKSKGLYKFMTLFGNTGFIGYPILAVILGEESLFMGAIFNIPYNLFLYTIGVYFIMSDRSKSRNMKLSAKHFLNPGIVATVIGLASFLSGIKLPDVVLGAATTLGSMTTPLAMIVVGGSLYGVKVSNLYKNYRIFIFSLIRMVIFPLIIGAFLSLIGLSGFAVGVPIVIVGMPIATNAVIMSRQYEGSILEASESVFISTVLMIVTIPILVGIIQLFS